MTNDLNERNIASDYAIDVSQGKVPGVRAITISGNNDNIGAAYETLSNVGGLYKYLDGSQTLDISSSSVNDTALGTGIRSVRITGLNGTFEEVEEVIALNGTTVVTTLNVFRRVFNAVAEEVGSNEYAAGTITGNSNTTADTMFVINQDENTSDNGIYTIPEGFVGNIQLYVLTNGQGDNVVGRLKVRLNGHLPGSPWLTGQKAKLRSSVAVIPVPGYSALPPRTDIELDGIRVSGGTDSLYGSIIVLLTPIADVPN